MVTFSVDIVNYLAILLILNIDPQNTSNHVLYGRYYHVLIKFFMAITEEQTATNVKIVQFTNSQVTLFNE